jgi:MYXO-CTERM domain-containing protein
MTSFFPIQATLYDKAAGRDTNWSPAGVPAPSWLALAALALGLAALRRR